MAELVREGVEILPWERQQGESVKAFHAFETYLRLGQDRTIGKVAEKLGRTVRTLYNVSSKNGWARRIDEWERHEAQLRLIACEREIMEMATRHATVGSKMLALAATGLIRHHKRLTKDEKASIPLKEVTMLAKAGVEIERWARGALTLQDPGDMARFVRATGGGGRAGLEVDQDQGQTLEEVEYSKWVDKYVQPEGSFLPHRLQRAAILSEARFLTLVCGVQSGKTTGGAVAFWRRIKDERKTLHERGDQGFYWMISPNSIVGEVMCEAFERFAPGGEIVHVKGQASGRTWTLRDGTRVQFRSGENGDKLVGRRVHGAWLDEYTILKQSVWTVSVRQRLATTNGWAIFTGTPRGQNWAYKEIWQRAQEGVDESDPDYAGFTWPSRENPAIDPSEVESARRQLPAAYFRREWEASWESFHGQIYQDWEERFAVAGLSGQAYPLGTENFGGKDFGFSNAGCLLIGRRLPNGEWWIVDEIYEAEKLPDWWKAKIAGAWATHEVEDFFADPAEPGQIKAMKKDGIPIKGAPNEVLPGIRRVASLIKQGRVLVDKHRCPHLISQLVSYKWKETSDGVRLEEPEKKNDHAVDALRYLLVGHEKRKKKGSEVRGYGSAKPKPRGR